MRTYEGLFLVDPVVAGREWGKVESTLQGTLKKHGGKILEFNKWGERKLAYEIRGHKRGTYVLAYFEASGDAVTKIRHDLNLTESVIRSMIVVHSGKIQAPPSVDGTAPVVAVPVPAAAPAAAAVPAGAPAGGAH